MRTARFRPRLERLETRLAPAGDVTARLLDGSLVLTGDRLGNVVRITQAAPGQFTVAGEDGTTVNGRATPLTVRQVAHDVRAALGAGADVVRLGSADGGALTVGRTLRIDGGAGDNAVFSAAALRVNRDFRIVNAAGRDRTDLTGRLLVGRHFVADNGAGDSATHIGIASAATGLNRVRGNLAILNGAGSHSNDVEDTNVGGVVTIDNGGGAEAYSFSYFSANHSPEPVWIGGRVVFRTRAGGSTNGLFAAEVAGHVSFVAERPGLMVTQTADVTALGDLAVRSAARAVVTVQETSVNRHLSIITAGADDQVTLANLDVRHRADVHTGGGADAVTVDDPLFYDAFTVTTGAGDDAVRLDTGTAAGHTHPAEVRGPVGVDLGTGNDALRLGSPGDAERQLRLLGPARFDGGAGTDEVDPANVRAPGGRVTYAGFERVVPQPPLRLGSRYAVQENVVAVAAADLDGDGVADLVAVNSDSGTVSALLGNGDGTFRAAEHSPAGAYPTSLAVGDVNGDGLPDLLVTTSTEERGVGVLLGNGDGSFQPRVVHPAGEDAAPVEVAAADFNADGRLDFATVNRAGNNQTSVTIRLGNGDGTFRAPLDFPLSTDPAVLDVGSGTGLAVGDLDGDQALDLVAAGLRGFGVLLGNGDGTFRLHAVEERPAVMAVALADLDGDGRLDLLLTGDGLGVQRLNGDGTFQPSVTYPVSGGAAPAIGDFNGDGIPDVATTESAEEGVVLLGNGDGTLGRRVKFIPGLDEGPLAPGDFNGDGALDLVVGNQYAGTISVLLNAKNWPPR